MTAMKDVSPEQRWTLQMVQARHFADREQYLEATARADEVRLAVKAALAAETDPARLGRLRRLLERVERQYDTFEAQFAGWRQKVEERRQARIAGAPEEMERPLPLPPPE